MSQKANLELVQHIRPPPYQSTPSSLSPTLPQIFHAEQTVIYQALLLIKENQTPRKLLIIFDSLTHFLSLSLSAL